MPQPANFSLFETDEPEKPLSIVQVLGRQKPATKAEQAFHRLVTQIERKREQLKAWQAFELRRDSRVAAEMAPLQVALRARQAEMAVLIDELLSRPPAAGRRLGKVQRAKLRQWLLNLLADLLAAADDGEAADDPVLVALYDKHADVSLAQERQDDLELTQAMLQDVFGMEVDKNGAESAEELFRRAQHKMQEDARARMQQAQARRDARSAGRSKAAQDRADAAQAQRAQAAVEVGQSVREVYRKLVSALHPDREPDAAARQGKTALMQRVNQAYDANDLLTLLGLQLEIEQIDAAHLASMSPQRLAHFNHVLREQLAELEGELAHHLQPWGPRPGRRAAFTPDAAEQSLNADLAGLRALVRDIEGELAAFRDPAQLRASLARYELEPDDDGIEGLDGLLSVFDVLSMAPRPGKRRRRS